MAFTNNRLLMVHNNVLFELDRETFEVCWKKDIEFINLFIKICFLISDQFYKNGACARFTILIYIGISKSPAPKKLFT